MIPSNTSPFQPERSLMHQCGHEVTPKKSSTREDKYDPAPPNEKPGYQEAFNCTSTRDPSRLEFYEKALDKNIDIVWHDSILFTVNKNIFNILTTPLLKIEEYESSIRNHIAMRVAHFFEQAVVCYDTPFYFRIADTEGQYFSAKTLKLKNGNKTKDIRYQAAHGSTIPDLDACDRKKWKKTKKAGKTPKFYTFLRRSHVSIAGNSTNSLPESVNQIDTLIDGHSSNKDPNKGLRARAIALINEVAQAKIDPCEATRRFLEDFEEIIPIREKAMKKLTDEKLEVINLYKDQVSQLIEQASIPNKTKDVHPFFDHLMSVNLSEESSKDIPKIRKIVFEQKYRIIRESQFTECKIREFLEEHCPSESQDGQNLFELSLVYQSHKEKKDLKITLEKLFCKSYAAIKKSKNLVKILGEYYLKHKTAHQEIFREIRSTVRNYRKMELCFQTSLLKEFRTTLRKMSEEELALSINAIVITKIAKELDKATLNTKKIDILNKTMTSASKIRKLETSSTYIFQNKEARKALTPFQVKIIAEALDVDVGHFFCSMFGSEYET